jgi:hypothetical protein
MMAKRKRNKKPTPEERARSKDVGRKLVERINHHRATMGLEPDPRLDVALNKTWREMTAEERAAERERQEEATRMLEERIAYHEARLADR